MLDLSDRIIQTPTPTRAPNGHLKWHFGRRALQVLCGVLLVLLPLTNGLRLDVRRGEFYFFWHKMAAHDLFLLFWIAMLGVWSLVAVSFLYGRLWCGWVCPQTLASDFADSVKARLDKAFRTRPGKPRFFVSRTLWTAILLTVSLGTSLILTCYWLAPGVVFAALRHPLSDRPAALTLWFLTALLAADMLWVRRKFCANACPYGALIGVLADENTLAVRYLDERDDDCIKCGKCVTDCPMDIDIKQGVMQHSCIGCGECVDACNDVLGKRGKAGLIEFRYGTQAERQTKMLTPSQKIGIWDKKRVGVLATLAIFTAIVAWNLWGHFPLRASVQTNGVITRNSETVKNPFALTVQNGAAGNQSVTVTTRGLPPGSFIETPGKIQVDAHGSKTVSMRVVAPSNAVKIGRTRFQFVVKAGNDVTTIPSVFYAPPVTRK